VLNFKIDIDKDLLEEKINNSFRKFFNIQNFSVQLKEEVDDLNWLFNEEFSPRIDESFSVQLKEEVDDLNWLFNEEFSPRIDESFSIQLEKTKSDLNEVFRKDFYIPKSLSFDIELRRSFFSVNESFSKFFGIESFNLLLDESKNINDSLFEEYFNLNSDDKILNLENIQSLKKREEIVQTEQVVNNIIQAEDEVLEVVETENNLNFLVELDNSNVKNINKLFIETFPQDLIENFSIQLKKSYTDLNEVFRKDFYTPKRFCFGIDLKYNSFNLNESFCRFFDIETFNLLLDESKNINDSLFEEYFKIENLTEELKIEDAVDQVVKNYFEINLDETKSVTDVIFEEYFKPLQQYDYNTIQKLRKSLNSRKILTREEREEFLKSEPLVSDIEVEKKKNISLEENIESNTEKIKDSSFYKIIQINDKDLEEPVENKVDEAYKEEVDKKIIDLENKYEDLLQKTKDDYESKLGKMVSDFSDFRNFISQQVTRMSFISSSSAGGGAVNILDMDDVNKADLGDGKSLVYDQNTKKFTFQTFATTESLNVENMSDVDISQVQDGDVLVYNSTTGKFETANLQTTSVEASLNIKEVVDFEITESNLTDTYLQLPSTPDNRYYHLSEVQINGLVNSHYPNHYTFIEDDRIDITNLNLTTGDKVRIVYIKS